MVHVLSQLKNDFWLSLSLFLSFSLFANCTVYPQRKTLENIQSNPATLEHASRLCFVCLSKSHSYPLVSYIITITLYCGVIVTDQGIWIIAWFVDLENLSCTSNRDIPGEPMRMEHSCVQFFNFPKWWLVVCSTWNYIATEKNVHTLVNCLARPKLQWPEQSNL